MTRAGLKERLPILITCLVLVLLTVAAHLRFGNFVTVRVMANLLADNATLGVVAVGLTFVILTGGIDLSVGSMIGLASIMAARLLQSGASPLVAFGVPLLAGAALGLAQGILIARFRLAPFLVTLGGLFFARGLALTISKQSVPIEQVGVKSFAEWAILLPGGGSITARALIFLLVLIVGIVAARQTRFGRTVYAIGGSESSAKLMGLATDRTLIQAYVLSGVTAALGGILFSLGTLSGNAIEGQGTELDAIAAVVIGGTLLSGGYGSVFGTFLGLMTIGVVQTAITFDGTLSSWWSRIAIGILLLTFMLIQRGIELAERRRA